MKNPYLRSILIISLVLVGLHVLLGVVDLYLFSNSSYSFQEGTMVTSADSVLNLIRIVQYVLGFPLYAIYFIFGGSEGSALLISIITSYVGPILIFTIWFAILYLTTYIISRFTSTNIVVREPRSNKKLALLCIVGIIVLNIGQVLYVYHLETSFDRPTPGAKVVSIEPVSVKVGDAVKIVVSGFTHEGYVYVSLVKYLSPGKGYKPSGTVWIGKIPQDNVVSFTLKDRNCFDSVLDKVCDLFVDALPGDYKLKIQSPADNISQEYDFKITQ